MSIDKFPLISIIVPVYNVGTYLKRCIESCLEQTYKDIEIVVIDDGSTDNNTIKLLKYYETRKNILILRQENKGVATARDVAANASHGDYLFFLDSDDYIINSAIELLVNALQDKRADIAIGSLAYDYKNKIIHLPFLIPSKYSSTDIICSLITDKLPLSLGGKLIRKNDFLILKKAHDLKIGEDAYLTLQLINKSHVFAFVEVPVYMYVQRVNSVMNKPSKTAIQSRVEFVRMVLDYFEASVLKYDLDSMWHSLAYFVLNQYYSIIIMGAGKDISDSYVKLVQLNVYIQDRKAINALPFWRKVLILTSFHCFTISRILVRGIIMARYVRKIVM